MNVTTFPAPPKDFDPTTASPSALLKYGYPRRPDAQGEPSLRALWDRVMARKPNFVPAELVEDKVWRSKPHASGKNAQFGSGNWAGAVVLADSPPTPPASYVFAEWKVPTIHPKPALTGQQVVGFWVGLGGYGVKNLLQAGTAAGITGTDVSYWAWVQWVPNPSSMVITTLTVGAGDTVSVLVCAPQSDHGFASMGNYTTNQFVSVGIHDPSGKTPYDGATAEWCVENPYSEMPNFGSVLFTQCTAGSRTYTLSLSGAIQLDAMSGSTTQATPKVLTAKNEVKVVWNATG